MLCFTGIGTIDQGEPYTFEMSKDFISCGRNATFIKVNEIPIEPLLDGLTFIKNKKKWGFAFRRGSLSRFSFMAYQPWRSSIEAILKTCRLTHPQFVILAPTGWLTRNGKLATQAAIGKMAGLDPNTTSQIIKGLEQKELIKRDKASDERAKNVSLAAKGAEILSRALPAVEKADVEFFNPLTKNE